MATPKYYHPSQTSLKLTVVPSSRSVAPCVPVLHELIRWFMCVLVGWNQHRHHTTHASPRWKPAGNANWRTLKWSFIKDEAAVRGPIGLLLEVVCDVFMHCQRVRVQGEYVASLELRKNVWMWALQILPQLSLLSNVHNIFHQLCRSGHNSHIFNNKLGFKTKIQFVLAFSRHCSLILYSLYHITSAYHCGTVVPTRLCGHINNTQWGWEPDDQIPKAWLLNCWCQ